MDSVQSVYAKIFSTHPQDALALKACEIAFEVSHKPYERFVKSIDVAIILADLKLDRDTLIATLLSDMALEPHYSIDDLNSQFGNNIAELVIGIRRLNHFKDFQSNRISNETQTERMRQMLLAMVSDIRIMIVKLAYRVARLRSLKHEPEEVRHQVAYETQLIFAPLANRLGIAQLKWELEDLSFRYLEPDTYQDVARQLDANRKGREAYIEKVIHGLKEMMQANHIDFHISGRPKHIYSIWKKMNRKKVPIDELYDLRAVRIYVDTVQQCYEVLGLIHSRWSYIREEFDDYIASPKENGYQSIHTVIVGTEDKPVEVQIRTYEMHHHAEFGVAAHWRYKEDGKKLDPSLENSINLVRQMLEYNDNPDLLNEISTELLSEHIYVMTPNSDIVTLSQGATPLDFAYQIHTELGHRCRGAKINGKIMPLTTPLKTGDKVEILAVKSGSPNRNWLNPNLKYLGNSRSRTKVRHWFNQQNKESNIEAGETLFNKESKRLHVKDIPLQLLLERFKCDSDKAFYEALGKGKINERQLTDAIQNWINPRSKLTKPLSAPPQIAGERSSAADGTPFVVGSPQLKTQIAPCCEPALGDEIVGYVTRGRGVTIHKQDCANILNLTDEEQRRLIEVAWTQRFDNKKDFSEAEAYEATLNLLAFDRKGLLRDVMTVLTEWDINLNHCDTNTNKSDGSVSMIMEIEVLPNSNIGAFLDQLEQVKNIVSTSINLNQKTATH